MRNRKPEPFFVTKRACWYVQMHGKQINLGRDKDAAFREYYRLMSLNGKVETREILRASLEEVCEVYLDNRKARWTPHTLENTGSILRVFCRGFPGKRLGDIRADQFVAWIASHEKWGDAYRHDFFVKVASVFKWAREVGYLETNPLFDVPCPWQSPSRVRIISDEELTRLLDNTDEVFGRFLRLLRCLGCRPNELCRVESRHLHPEKRLIVLTHKEHKTGKKTGRIRVIPVPDQVLMDELRALAVQFPEGVLLRNKWGRPWTPDNVAQRMRDTRRRLGMDENIIPYATRHTRATEMLDNGMSEALAAKVLGHADTSMIHRHYYHKDADAMLDALDTIPEVKARKAAAKRGRGRGPN